MSATEAINWLKKKNSFQFPFSFVYSWLRLIFQFVGINKDSRKILKEARNDIEYNQSNLEFSAGIHHRIWQYVIFHGFLAYLLASFKGTKPSRSQLNRFAYLSVCAPLFDDLSDFWKLNESEILNLIRGDEIAKMPAITSKYVKKYIQLITDSLSEPSIKTFEATMTKLIKEQGIEHNNKKGAYGMLLYSSLMNEEYSDLDIKWMLSMGQLGQYIDDIFDYYKDKKNGIQTWANQFSIDQLRNQYLDEVRNMIQLFTVATKNRPSLHTSFFWHCTSLLSTPLVAIEFYENNAKKPLGLRKEHPICDMEKLSNRVALIKYSWYLGKKLSSS